MNRINIYKKGIANENFIKKEVESNYLNIKLIILYLILLIFTKKKKVGIENLNIVNGKHQYKILSKISDEDKEFIHLNKIELKNNIFNNKNIISRFKFVMKTIYEYVLKRKIIKNYSFWLEYSAIYEYLTVEAPKEITVAGHYDRYTTWISNICKEKKIKFKIIQHGAAAQINLPEKIFSDEISVYSLSEKKIFKESIIKNLDCQYNIEGFKSVLKFKKVKKTEKILFGIASQPGYTDITIELAKKISKNKKIEVIIYPHPKEKGIRKIEGVKILRKYKVSNIDFLFTYYSTLVYDYLSNENFKGKIFVMPPINLEQGFFHEENVEKILEIEDLLNKFN